MILGTICVVLALSLLIYNQHEAKNAEKASAELMPKLISKMETDCSESHSGFDIMDAINLNADMDTITIDGQEYIGYLFIPALGLELPIMYDWSYPQLRIAPCRFTGTLKENNLVLMAHNYGRLFGRLRTLSVGESIYFCDVHGVKIQYEVAEVDILSFKAVEEMTSGDFDLTLFTCTYGNRSRVTVRCNRI